MKIESTSDLRQVLIDTIEDVRIGKVNSRDATAIASLSGKILQSAKLDLDCAKHQQAVSEAKAPVPFKLVNKQESA